jgi:hypothetical protein
MVPGVVAMCDQGRDPEREAGFQVRDAAGFLLAAECVMAEKLDRYPAELDEAMSALQALIGEARRRLRQVEAFFDGP